jgi:hypothetical protein
MQAMWAAVVERNEARDPAELKAARAKAELLRLPEFPKQCSKCTTCEVDAITTTAFGNCIPDKQYTHSG